MRIIQSISGLYIRDCTKKRGAKVNKFVNKITMGLLPGLIKYILIMLFIVLIYRYIKSKRK